MIVVKIDGVLATRPRAIYLGRRPHRAGLILSNLLSVPAKTLSRGRPMTQLSSRILLNRLFKL